VRGGEPSAATTVTNTLFQAVNTPSIIYNTIGAVLASTGVVTLPGGAYLVEFGGSAINSGNNQNVGAVTLYVSSSQVNAVSAAASLYTNGGYVDGTKKVFAVQCTGNGSINGGSVLWDTLIYGAALSLGGYNAYTAGSETNNAWLRITQVY
jgi:hypothetical protein